MMPLIFLVMSLLEESEHLDSNWIITRRDRTLALENTIELAPESWKMWIRYGKSSPDRFRRRVSKLFVTPTIEQRPKPGSRAEKTLEEIYRYYAELGRQRIEALAAVVSAKVIGGSGENYVKGWITPPSSDWGVDFIGRLDVGTGFSKTRLVVLGQAKCERLNNPTSGTHIARTVARLKRGWVGVYVTTSYFSEQV